jgi:hypothetical protein
MRGAEKFRFFFLEKLSWVGILIGRPRNTFIRTVVLQLQLECCLLPPQNLAYTTYTNFVTEVSHRRNSVALYHIWQYTPSALCLWLHNLPVITPQETSLKVHIRIM